MKPQSGSAATKPIGPFQPTARPLPEGAHATREPAKHVPQMSLKERDRRWDKVRKKMLTAGLDAFVFLGNDIYWGMGMANLRYMLQVDTHLGAEAIFPLAGDPVAWTGVPHMNRPTNMYHSLNTWMTDFRTRGGMPAVADELKSRGLERSKLGLVGFSSTIQITPTILHQDVLALQKLLPEVQFVDASWILEEMRIVKSEEEIEMLRKAGRIARKVVDPIPPPAPPGLPPPPAYPPLHT